MEAVFDMVCTEKIQISPERLNGKGNGLFQVYHLAAEYNRYESINLGLDGEKIYSGRMIFPAPVKAILANNANATTEINAIIKYNILPLIKLLPIS